MTITFKSVDATYVDLSAVEDVERERLLVSFGNDKQLMLRIDLRHTARAPRLVVDYDIKGTNIGLWPTTYALRNLLTDQYYTQRVHRSTAKKFADWLSRLMKPSWPAPFTGWTYDRVWKELEIVVDPGSKQRQSPLVVGDYLRVEYGVGDYDPIKEGLGNLGRIVSIESVMIEPTSLVGASAEM